MLYSVYWQFTIFKLLILNSFFIVSRLNSYSLISISLEIKFINICLCFADFIDISSELIYLFAYSKFFIETRPILILSRVMNIFDSSVGESSLLKSEYFQLSLFFMSSLPFDIISEYFSFSVYHYFLLCYFVFTMVSNISPIYFKVYMLDLVNYIEPIETLTWRFV